MRQTICSIVLSLTGFAAIGQSSAVRQINETNPPSLTLAPLRFLASDELMGRSPKRPEINVAARYISESFRSMGLKEVAGTTDYFQTFQLRFKKAPTAGGFNVAGHNFEMLKTLLSYGANDTIITAPIIYANHGMESDLRNLDVKGKIVITEFGETDSSTTQQAGAALFGKKQALLKDKGAIAVIERYRGSQWSMFQQNISNEAFMRDEANFPILLVNDTAGILKKLPGTSTGTLTIQGTQIRSLPAKNVMGWLEGSDPKLKDQFIVLSSHYDHLGVAAKPKMEEGKLDSIYNGARDNAIGVTSVIAAARYFTQYRPKRSILFIAYTAEEMGLVGSRYFAANPPLPLNTIVYNLNMDNSSYNDTTIVSVVGLGRMSADDEIRKACLAFGLTAMPDPAPEQNFFDRSDNVSLAVKGIPAPTFALGIRQFDKNITNRYHQLSDEVDNMNLYYTMKVIKSFILAAKNISENPVQPTWNKGDKYEAAWKSLYGK